MGVPVDDGRCSACEPGVRVGLWLVIPEPVGRVPVGLSPAGRVPVGLSPVGLGLLVGASLSTPSRATKAVDNGG